MQSSDVVSDPGEDEGVLDPWVVKWFEENPQPDWMKDGFPPDIRDLMRSYVGPPPTRQFDQVTDELVGAIPVRIYRNARRPEGVVIYLHGGAFIVGGLDIMDNVARELAHAADATVVSVEYRLAPENPYPAGLDDCEVVTHWVRDHADRFDVPPSAIALAGESAGGNLAAGVSLRLRDQGSMTVCGQALIYPCTDGPGVAYPSREQFGAADWVWEQYGGGRDLSDAPYAFPLRAKSLRDLPPALVILAGCDSLRDEGRAYAARLREEGVEVEETCYRGQPHGFVNYGFPAATPAFEQIGRWLGSRFAAARATVP